MERRLLISNAGTGPSNSLVRSLGAGDPSLFIVGFHDDRFVLKKSSADKNYLVPGPDQPGFRDALLHIVRQERIDLLIPNDDPEVRIIGDFRAELPCRVFLPQPAVIALCQDKYDLTAFLLARGLPAPATYPVSRLDEIDKIFRRLAPHRKLWCRIRTGSRSMGAIPVTRPAQARSWIEYWEEMRGVPATSFTLSEYLPGRDFSCQSLWKDGALVLVKVTERLSYFGGASRASGASSNAALAKTVVEPGVVEVCTNVIQALDGAASGVFSIDLRENASRIPCVTEINVGRFFSTTNLFDLTGKHNMALTYVRLALDEPLDIADPDDTAEDYYFVRDLDSAPDVVHADELFRGIHEVGR
jgi:hypothetical protein